MFHLLRFAKRCLALPVLDPMEPTAQKSLLCGTYILGLCLGFIPVCAQAFDQMKSASDLITTSAPNTGAGHEINVTLTSSIKPGESFVIDLAGSSAFNIPEGFSFADVDFA